MAAKIAIATRTAAKNVHARSLRSMAGVAAAFCRIVAVLDSTLETMTVILHR
jgi:hypothetical protein